MITIQFDSKFQVIAQLLDSIRNEKNTICTALVVRQSGRAFQTVGLETEQESADSLTNGIDSL